MSAESRRSSMGTLRDAAIDCATGCCRVSFVDGGCVSQMTIAVGWPLARTKSP
jgi:hypothetical protein